jgi:tRNA 2-thiouridine synthesizing protein A
MKHDLLVDAKTLSCPMPLLKAKQGLNALNVGQVVNVLATDAGSVKDFQSFVDLTNHKLLLCDEVDGVYRYWIEKG